MQIKNKPSYLWGILGIALVLYPIYTLYINYGFFYTKKYDFGLILGELLIWTIIMLIGYKKLNTIWLGLVLLLFSYVHSMLLPIVSVGIYYVFTALIGGYLLWLIFKKKSNYFDSSFCGMIFFILLYCIASIFRIGSIEKIRVFCIVACIIALFITHYIFWKGNYKIQFDKVLSAIYVSKQRYLMLMCIALFFMIQIGRAPISLDYDSCWYGTRSGYVLDNVTGIYDDLKLVGCVYLYPKGAEIFSLPFANLDSYTFVTTINIFAVCLIVGLTYKICKLFVDKNKALFGALVCSSIPGIMNMSVTAKPDLLTLFIQLIMIYHFLKFLKYKQGKEWIYIWASYVFSLNFKPTSVLFSTTILLAGIFVCIVFKIRKKDKIKGYFLLVISLISLLFVWGRTYFLSGVPCGNLLASIFRKMGFVEKYPYNMSPFSPIASNRSIKDRFSLVCEFLFAPKTENGDHIIIAWGTTLCTFLAIVGIVAGIFTIKKIFIEKKSEQLFIFALLAGEMLGAVLMVFVFRKPDGNYFQLYYVVCVISVIMYDEWIQQNSIRKNVIFGSLIILMVLNVALTSSTNWVWCSSFSDISLKNIGYINHKAEYMQIAKERGFENIYDILQANPSNKVYAIAEHPDIERIPCVIESQTDVGYWGNPQLLESEDSFLKFVNYEKYDYILLDMSYCSVNDINNIKRLIIESIVQELYVENQFVLLTMGKSDGSINNNMLEILDGCIELRYVEGDLYDDGWLGKNCLYSVNLQNSKTIRINVNNVNSISGQKLICSFLDNTLVYDIYEGENTIELELPTGNYNINFEMFKTFTPNNGDQRKLSVLFNISY